MRTRTSWSTPESRAWPPRPSSPVLAAAPVGAAEGDAHVRVLHSSPDAPAVDVYVDGAKVDALSGLEFGDLTEYVALAGGTYDLKVCADTGNTVCPLDPGALDLAAGRSYSVFAIGSLAGETLTAAVGVDGVVAPATDAQSPAQQDGSPSGLALAALALVGVAAFIESLRWTTVRARR